MWNYLLCAISRSGLSSWHPSSVFCFFSFPLWASATYIMMRRQLNDEWCEKRNQLPLLLNPVYCRVSLLKWFSLHSSLLSFNNPKSPKRTPISNEILSYYSTLWLGRGWGGTGGLLVGCRTRPASTKGKSSSEFYTAELLQICRKNICWKQETNRLQTAVVD